jgi:hypothetical protein
MTSATLAFRGIASGNSNYSLRTVERFILTL